jgi:hypothetical protein
MVCTAVSLLQKAIYIPESFRDNAHMFEFKRVRETAVVVVHVGVDAVIIRLRFSDLVGLHNWVIGSDRRSPKGELNESRMS